MVTKGLKTGFKRRRRLVSGLGFEKMRVHKISQLVRVILIQVTHGLAKSQSHQKVKSVLTLNS